MFIISGERHSGLGGGALGVTTTPPPPPPPNVWQDRSDFMSDAMPSSEQQEMEMLQAALEMSRLEAEAQRIAHKL